MEEEIIDATPTEASSPAPDVSEDIKHALGKLIYGKWSYSSKTKKYHNADLKKTMSKEDALREIKDIFTDNHASLFANTTPENFKLLAEDVLKDAVTQQKTKRLRKAVAQTVSGTQSSGMDAKVEVNPLWRPKTTFNTIDATWCRNLIRYDDVLYFKQPNGSLVILGGLSLQSLGSTIDKIIKYSDLPDPDSFCKDQVSMLTIMQRELDSKDSGDREDAIVQLNRTVGDILHKKNSGGIYDKTLQDFLNLKDCDVDEIMSVQEVSSKLVYKFVNDRLPASIQFGLMKVVKCYDQFSTDDSSKKMSVFTGFTIQSKGDFAVSKRAYFEHVLTHHRDSIQTIDYLPRCATMDDDPTYSYGKFNRKLFEEDMQKYGDLTYDTSKLVKTFGDSMDRDQRMWTFAWYYALFFLYPMVISKCHIDGGGTLKTAIKNLVSFAMIRYFGADISYPMGRNSFLNPADRYDDNRKISLAECRFCPYDEPDTRGELWEEFKENTGNLTLGMRIKVLYRNVSRLPTTVLFDIGSNKPIYISDGGAFQRRIAFIRTAASNTCRILPTEVLKALTTFDATNKTMTDDQIREFIAMIKLGKKCYDKIVKDFGSLETAAVTMPSIAKELVDANLWDIFYGDFYDSLFTENDEFVRIANKTIDEKFDAYCKVNHPPKNADSTGLRTYFKKADGRNANGVFKVRGEENKAVRGWTLYKVARKEKDDAIFVSAEEIGLVAKADKFPTMGDNERLF